jgi:diguanylate cyclase (GGDEF)-like protein
MSLVTSKKGPRISLVKVFSAGLGGILLAFALLSYFTFSRLTHFESTLVQISNQDLPNLINTSQLFNQAARLLQSTELLSKSSSQASKRIVQRQLESNLLSIRKASQVIKNNQFLDMQFDTIKTEINEFSNLVGRRLDLRSQMESLQVKISILSEQASKIDPASSASWLLDYLQALINVNQALDERRLQRVRFLFDQLEKRLVNLNNSADTAESLLVKRHMIDELNTLLFASDGLVELKIKSLRIEGKVIGRANFVHNLIEDYLSQLGYATKQTEQLMTAQVAKSVENMQQQIYLLTFLLVASVIFIFLVVVVFQRRILNRLKIINHTIRSEAQGAEYPDILRGNDEISDLAESFRAFTHTIARQKHILKQLSMLDSVTGIANGHALDIRLAQEIEMSRQNTTQFAVMLLDIDCFKQYNDNYQSSAGDDCLQQIAKMLSDLLPSDGDFIARHEDKDFICVLSETDKTRAQEIAGRILEALNKQALPHGFSHVAHYVSMSIGISIGYPNKPVTPEELIYQADIALNEAKASGKNTYR